MKKGLEQSLRLFGTDYIDVYHLHGVEPKDYDFARERLMPVMRRLREQGKIRFIGVTEGFVQDPSHQMLQQSLREDLWDVVMVGFNLLNPSARGSVFPRTREKQVGVLNMFAVRRALIQPDRLKGILTDLIHEGVILQKRRRKPKSSSTLCCGKAMPKRCPKSPTGSVDMNGASMSF